MQPEAQKGQRKDVQHMADYGYFGKGAEGYAHYSQTFNSTFPNSGSKSSSHNTVHSCPSAAKKEDAEPQNSTDQSNYTDPDLENATLNVLFSVGMFVLAAVVFIAIVVSL